MIVKKNKNDNIKIRESLILPRLIKVLENVNVTIILSNGTKITGTVESYGKKIKTISLKTALSELEIANGIYKDLNEYISEDEQLSEINEYYNASRTRNGNINTNSGNFSIIGDFKSYVLLKDSKVEFNSKIVEVSHTSIPESHISTLTINNMDTPSSGMNSAGTGCNNNSVCRMDIKKMIINSHKSEIKNEAFVRCNRIGRNNIKN